MEGNSYLTAGDLALFNEAKYGRGYEGYPWQGHKSHATATTGVALGASALGVAIVGALAIGWGVNQASKARSKSAEQANTLLASNLNQLTQLALTERQSRENWQNYHAPSITQYTDVRTGAGSLSGAGATATAEALALSALVNGTNGRSGQVCPQPVALYQPAMPCRCNTCGD